MDKDNIDEKKDTIRVTIVDDEKLFLKVVRLNLLQSIGSFPNYEMVVETFPHGEALLERPDTVAGTDVFIVDEVLGAGRMRGRELIPKLRELAGHARFILYSGKKITSREVGPLTLLGVDYFCPKPLDYPDIIQKIISGYRSSRLSRNLKQARNIMSHLQDDIPPAYRDTLPDTNDDSNPGITLELVRDIARRLAIRATLDNINRENTEAGIINALFSGLLDFGVGRCRYYLVNENLEVFERVNETAGHETLREQTLFSIKPNSWILDRACPEFVYGYKIFLKADSEMLSDRTEISSFPTISFLMKSEDRITGIIDIDGGETKNLGEDNIGYIKNLTNHAALAIQNARNVRLSTILSETIGRLAVKTSVKAISKEVVGLVSTILDIDSTTLFLFNREINSLEKKAAYILTKDRLEGPPESHDTEYRAGNFFISVSEAFMHNDVACQKDFLFIHEPGGAVDNKNDLPDILMDKILIACREEYNQFDAGKTLSSGPIHSAVFIPLYYKGLRVGLIRCLNKLNNRRMVLKSGFRKDEFETLGKIGNIIAPLLANLIYKDKTSEMIRYMMKESASSNPDRTFFLILTCITSGKDLGFDRAVLFIKENDHLVIKRAVGPCNEAENQEMRNDPIWKELARKSVDQFLDLFKLLYDFPMESIPFFKDHAANSRDHYLSAKFDEEKPDLEIKESKLKEFLEKNFWSKPDNKNKKYILYSDFDKNDYAAFPYTSIMLEWLYRPGVRNGASGLSSRRMALKWAAVPLISRQKTIGWLYVDNVYSGAEIHLIDIDILLFFSNFITEVLKSTDGYRKSNKINELTSEITETADMNTIVRHTRQKLIGDDFPEITDVCILLKKKDDHRFTPGDKKNYKFIDDYYVSCSDGQLQYLEQEDNYLLFPGSGAIQMIVKEESRQAKSRLIVPVILGKHIVGYIIIDGPETNDYSDFDVERFKSLASHLGALLKKNREERKHEKHLRMLSHEIRSNLQTALTKFELMFRQDVVKPAEIVSKSKAGYYGIKDTIGMLQKFENVVSSKSKKAYHIVNLPLHTLLLSALRLPGEIKNAEAAHKMIIKADKKSFQTVLENLYDNALKYSQDNTRYPVEVSLAQPTADRIDIVFVNYGLKIKDTRRIFEEWHRELDDKYIRDKIKGSGLGLHIVKNIVREHGWGIKAESIPDSQKECYRNTFTLSIQIEAPPHKPHEEMGVQ